MASSIYIVLSNDKIPILAFESYQDAQLTVMNLFGKSAEAYKKHLISIPFSQDGKKSLNLSDVEDVVDITIKATLKSYESVADKFVERLETK